MRVPLGRQKFGDRMQRLDTLADDLEAGQQRHRQKHSDKSPQPAPQQDFFLRLSGYTKEQVKKAVDDWANGLS